MLKLQLGDTGTGVDGLHQDLIEQGFDVGVDASDHVFGHDTLDAVTQFQACHVGSDRQPLKVDGVVGDATLWALAHPSSSDQDAHAMAQPVDVDVPGIGGTALKFALAELRRGVREDPDGSNRGDRIDLYTGFKGAPGVRGPAWCAYLVSWCVDQAAKSLNMPNPMGIIGSAHNIIHWGERNRCALVPGACLLRPGDIAVISRDDGHGHCMFVRSVLPGSAPNAGFHSVEGNAGNAVRSYTRRIETISRIVRLPVPQQTAPTS
jgi:hypothetical protein